MKNNFRYALSILLALGLGFSSFVACDLDEEPNKPGPQTPGPQTPGPQKPDQKVEYEEYKFVRIQDITPESELKKGEDPGADIDAVVLVKKGTNEKIYAGDVKDYKPKTKVAGDNSAFDPKKSLNAPDAFYEYANNNLTKCRLNKADGKDDRTYTSLAGGHLIVEMEKAIEAGDILYVLEVADCVMENCIDSKACKGNKADKREKVSVDISYSSTTDGVWKSVATEGTGPQISANIPELQKVPKQQQQP